MRRQAARRRFRRARAFAAGRIRRKRDSGNGRQSVLARDGYDSWLFHKGSSEIRIFVYDGNYLFSTSPINLLPKKEVENVLDYMLSEDFGPYKLGIEGRQIYIAYRIHLADHHGRIGRRNPQKTSVGLALRADEMITCLVERFGLRILRIFENRRRILTLDGKRESRTFSKRSRFSYRVPAGCAGFPAAQVRSAENLLHFEQEAHRPAALVNAVLRQRFSTIRHSF